jgi:hypothetical protein
LADRSGLEASGIFDGHRLAREIDGADPSVALPFDRERNVPVIEPRLTREVQGG